MMSRRKLRSKKPQQILEFPNLRLIDELMNEWLMSCRFSSDSLEIVEETIKRTCGSGSQIPLIDINEQNRLSEWINEIL